MAGSAAQTGLVFLRARPAKVQCRRKTRTDDRRANEGDRDGGCGGGEKESVSMDEGCCKARWDRSVRRGTGRARFGACTAPARCWFQGRGLEGRGRVAGALPDCHYWMGARLRSARSHARNRHGNRFSITNLRAPLSNCRHQPRAILLLFCLLSSAHSRAVLFSCPDKNNAIVERMLLQCALDCGRRTLELALYLAITTQWTAIDFPSN